MPGSKLMADQEADVRSPLGEPYVDGAGGVRAAWARGGIRAA